MAGLRCSGVRLRTESVVALPVPLALLLVRVDTLAIGDVLVMSADAEDASEHEVSSASTAHGVTVIHFAGGGHLSLPSHRLVTKRATLL